MGRRLTHRQVAELSANSPPNHRTKNASAPVHKPGDSDIERLLFGKNEGSRQVQCAEVHSCTCKTRSDAANDQGVHRWRSAAERIRGREIDKTRDKSPFIVQDAVDFLQR